MTSVFQVYTGSSALCSHSDLIAFVLSQFLYDSVYFNPNVSNMRIRIIVFEENSDNTFFEDISHVYVFSKPPYSYTEQKSGKN